MDNQFSRKWMILTIILAAVCISGSMIYLGWQIAREKTAMDEKILHEKIEKGIVRFIQKQKERQLKSQSDRKAQAEKGVKKVRPVSNQRDHIYGSPQAEISLIEYSDFECPFCKRFHPTPYKIVDLYQGRVNWVYRHFPLGFHNPAAQREAEAAECVGEQGGNKLFFEYSDLIYRNTKSNGVGLTRKKLVAMAENIGLDKEEMANCLSSSKFAQRVKEDYVEGSAIGISGTPGVVLLNNRTGDVKFKSGAYPLETYKTLIDQLLSKKPE